MNHPRRYSLTDALILAAKMEHRKAKRGDTAAAKNFVGYSMLAVSGSPNTFVTTATHDCIKIEAGDRRWIIPEKDQSTAR